MMIGFYPATYTRGTASLHTGRAWEWLSHDTPLGIGINGGFAVAIFLLLSGYVLFLGKDRKKEPDYVAGSIVSRYFLV